MLGRLVHIANTSVRQYVRTRYVNEPYIDNAYARSYEVRYVRTSVRSVSTQHDTAPRRVSTRYGGTRDVAMLRHCKLSVHHYTAYVDMFVRGTSIRYIDTSFPDTSIRYVGTSIHCIRTVRLYAKSSGQYFPSNQSTHYRCHVNSRGRGGNHALRAQLYIYIY